MDAEVGLVVWVEGLCGVSVYDMSIIAPNRRHMCSIVDDQNYLKLVSTVKEGD